MSKAMMQKAMDRGNGILRMIPSWVPRSFMRPGKRLRLHMDDYYPYGIERGAIDERWMASTAHADNGPDTPGDEGMSYLLADDEGKERILFKDLVEEFKADVIGDFLWSKYHDWPMYAGTFDNLGPLPHHLHHDDYHAAKVNQKGKPEMYFFPSQLNNHPGECAFTFFGLSPEVTKDQLRQALENYPKGDNRILELSRAYKLKLDTGWDIPPGILHAPGSLLTYEPQIASEISTFYQSVLHGEHIMDKAFEWINVPEDRIGDYDYLIELLDWELNVDPDFRENRYMEPKPARPFDETMPQGYFEEWCGYKSKRISCKRLTVLPRKTITIKDGAPYGFFMLQGFGNMEGFEVSAPNVIRFGQLTNDEYFICADKAKVGVTITNLSNSQPIVMLKHFAENPDLVFE